MVRLEIIDDEEAAELYRLQGNNAFRVGKFDEAVYFYTEALQYQKTNVAIYTNRAAASLRIDNCLQAEDDCTKALELDKKNPKAFNRRAQAREKLGNLKGALEDFELAYKYSKDPSVVESMERVKEAMKKREEEEKHAEAQPVEPEEEEEIDVEKLRAEAKQLFQDGQFQQAAAVYSHILENPLPEDIKGMVLNNRAACYVQMKHEADALVDLDAVLVIDPYNTKARLRRALVLENIERYGKAYDDYRLLLQMDPALSKKASENIRRLTGHFPELKERPTPELPPRPAFSTMPAPAPEPEYTPEELKDKGNEKLRAGDFKTAVSLYSMALQKDPSNAVLFGNRATAFFSLGKFEESVNDARMAVELDPSYEKGYFRLGNALRKLGRTKEAVEAFKEGARANPDNKTFPQEIAKLTAKKKKK